MMVSATAPGKLVLLGEFAVLEGAPALVLAADRRAAVHVTTSSAETSILDAPALGIRNHPVRITADGLLPAAQLTRDQERALAVLGCTAQEALAYARARGHEASPVVLRTESEAFATKDGEKYGFGSSAAIATAAFAALAAAWTHAVPSREEILTAATAAHRRAQGGGSGLDVAAACYGGVIHFWLHDTTPHIEPVSLPPGLLLFAVWSGCSQDTSVTLAALRHFRQGNPMADDLIAKLGEAGRMGLNACRYRRPEAFLGAMRMHAQNLLALQRISGISLNTKTHERASTIVESRGGAYKPSGAGGDLGLAACLNAPTATRVMKGLSTYGLSTFPLSFDAQGVEATLHG